MRTIESISAFGSNRVRGLWVALLLCMFALAAPAGATAATNQLAFSPSSATVATGGNVNVDITISNVTNLGGYNLYLQFNPAVVHLTSLVDSGFVTSNVNNIVICNAATIDNTAGTATDSCATQAIFGTPGPGVSATTPVPLMHASFTGVGNGTSSLTLTGTNLLDPNGIQLTPAPTLGTGSITVASSVGGLAELPDLAALHSAGASTSGGGRTMLFVLAAIAIAALFSLAAGVAWRRARKTRADGANS